MAVRGLSGLSCQGLLLRFASHLQILYGLANGHLKRFRICIDARSAACVPRGFIVARLLGKARRGGGVVGRAFLLQSRLPTQHVSHGFDVLRLGERHVLVADECKT